MYSETPLYIMDTIGTSEVSFIGLTVYQTIILGNNKCLLLRDVLYIEVPLYKYVTQYS